MIEWFRFVCIVGYVGLGLGLPVAALVLPVMIRHHKGEDND